MSQVRGRSPRRVGDGTFREMREPIILAVHEDGAALGEVQEALLERYAKRYRVICVPSADAGPHGAGRRRWRPTIDIALVLAAQWLAGGSTGSELLDEVWSMHPRARRALLIEWGDWGQTPTGQAIFDGIARGCFDHYVVRPAASPDEMFHQTISSMLLDWAEANRAAPYTVHVVGDVVVGPGLRDPRGVAGVRSPAHLLPGGLARGAGARRRRRRRRRAADDAVPQRRGAGEPHQRGDRGCGRCADRPGAREVRPGDRRCRAGRACPPRCTGAPKA